MRGSAPGIRRLPTIIKWACVAGLIAFVAGGTWIVRLPEDVFARAAAVPSAESTANLVQLRPPKRPQRPVIAVISLNAGTETTDYLMPTGILRRADIAEVKLVAIEDNPVKLYPALSVQPDVGSAGVGSGVAANSSNSGNGFSTPVAFHRARCRCPARPFNALASASITRYRGSSWPRSLRSAAAISGFRHPDLMRDTRARPFKPYKA